MIGLWNFVLTGEHRSGAAIVASALNNRSDVVCHANLLHSDAKIREASHASYFVESATTAYAPVWDPEGTVGLWQYLEHFVFPAARRNEAAVGIRLSFDDMRRLDMYDMLTRQYLAGNFSVVHVSRNPVACFVSLKQAERSGLWSKGPNAKKEEAPRSIVISPEELTLFCRNYEATTTKIRESCADTLNITYRDILEDFQTTMYKVCEFLELFPTGKPALSSCVRLVNKPIPDRVTNWHTLIAKVPTDIRRLIESEDLF